MSAYDDYMSQYDPDEDEYSKYMRQIGESPSAGSVPPGIATAAATAPATGGASLALEGAGLGVDTLGKIVGAYGAYQDEQDAKALAERVRTHDWTQEAAQAAQAAAAAKQGSAEQAGSYADNTLEELLRRYGLHNN